VSSERQVPTSSAFFKHSWLDAERDLKTFETRTEPVSLVVPTLNEQRGLEELLELTSRYADELLVVDGGSSDGTVHTATKAGARCVRDGGGGKGLAIRKAIEVAEHDVLVFMDADYSHDPADIPRLAAPILRGEYDHVFGSRTRGGSDELHGNFEKFMRMMGSDIITLGINYRFGVRFTDSQNGFRAGRRSRLLELGLRERITTIEQEMTIKSVARGHRVLEIPTHEYRRRFGGSHIQLPRVAPRYVYSWLKYLIAPY